MQGGLFGLSAKQRGYLYICCLLPSAVVLIHPDLLMQLVLLQFVYLVVVTIYIRFLSLERSLFPYLSNQLSKLRTQTQKGGSLGLSAYLLITIYGILILRLGRVALPSALNLGTYSHSHPLFLFLFALLNAFSQELFWRLFLPKTFQTPFQQSEIINCSYLLFHFILATSFLGGWRALPFVGTFFSVARSLSHIRNKYGIVSALLTHLGITLAAFTLFLYLYHSQLIHFS